MELRHQLIRLQCVDGDGGTDLFDPAGERAFFYRFTQLREFDIDKGHGSSRGALDQQGQGRLRRIVLTESGGAE